MKFWGEKGETSYPWKSLDTWFVTENIRWGKFEPDLDIKALVDKTNRSDLWLRGGKGARRCRRADGRQPRHREVLRRQGVRSGRSAWPT